jgi:hypothetical protein
MLKTLKGIQLMKCKLTISLNGTNTNPFHILGTNQNPFPQIATAERQASCLALQKLGGDPIPNIEYIRQTLKGHFTDEFIDFVCNEFKPGEYIKFVVEWSE